MGLRFRKTFGKGPLRVNISKSGVGYSVGTKGLRYTKKAGGGTRTTASIPGTGISYVSDSSPKPSGSSRPSGTPAQQGSTVYCPSCYKMVTAGTVFCPNCGTAVGDGVTAPKKQNNGCVLGCLISVIMVAIAFWLIGTVFRSCANIVTSSMPNAPTIDTSWEEPLPSQPETTAPNPTETTPDLSYLLPNADSDQRTYVLNTGSHKYHLPSCVSVDDIDPSNKETFTGTRSQLLAMGYEPCGRCLK